MGWNSSVVCVHGVSEAWQDALEKLEAAKQEAGKVEAGQVDKLKEALSKVPGRPDWVGRYV